METTELNESTGTTRSVAFSLGGTGSRQVRAGCGSRSVPGKWNEDRVAIARPAAQELATHGLALAIADGIGGDGSGGQAAALAVRSILHDYYATPAEWSPARALDRVLRAANDWLYAQNERRADGDASLTTLSVLIVRDDRYYLAHVGDTRIYLGRAGSMKRLTADHSWPRHDLRHVPKRAIGLDSHLVVDFADGALQAGDTFLLVTDGVWEVLGDALLAGAVGGPGGPDVLADSLVTMSLERQARYMGRNDASAAVLVVD